MPTANDVMEQIWVKEGIYVRMETSKPVPGYRYAKKYPQNRSVEQWASSRLGSYDPSTITVVKGINKRASAKMSIETLRLSYDRAAVEYIESQLRIGTIKQKLKKSKAKHSKILETARHEAESAKKEAESAKKQTAVIKGAVKKISGENVEIQSMLEISLIALKHAEFICNNIEKVIRQVCDSDAILKGHADAMVAHVKEKLLIESTREKLHQIRLNLPADAGIWERL